MQTNEKLSGRIRQTVDDFVVAEIFLLQATIESVSAVSATLGQYRADTTMPIRPLLQRTKDEVVDSYTSRYQYFRRIVDKPAKE